MDPEEFQRRFPERDWFPARHWQDSVLFERSPALVEEAMRALSELVPPQRFRDLFLRNGDQYHPLHLGLTDAGWMSFWPAFKIGFDVHAVGLIPESLCNRLLKPAEVRGAESELAAGASLARAELKFDWFPPEGGEFRVEDDVIGYVEVKRPQSESDRTRREMSALTKTFRRLMEAFPRLTTAYALRTDLAETITNRQRKDISWTWIADELIAAGRDLVEAGEIPGRRDCAAGTIWLAHSHNDMRSLGAAGASGFFLDGNYEADRVIRSVVNRAVRQLPSRALSLICIDWTSPPSEFFDAVVKRLARLQDTDAPVAGVLVRERMFSGKDVVPMFSTTFIENPRHPGVTEASRVRRALEVDEMREFRRTGTADIDPGQGDV